MSWHAELLLFALLFAVIGRGLWRDLHRDTTSTRSRRQWFRSSR